MWELLFSVIVPLVKWVAGKASKKNLSDKEFVAYILASKSRTANAGKSALDFEKALDKAFKDLEASDLEEAEKELAEHQAAGEGL